MEIEEMYDILDSFVPLYQDLVRGPLKWRGAGRQGIQSLNLYGMLALKGWPFESFIYCQTR